MTQLNVLGNDLSEFGSKSEFWTYFNSECEGKKLQANLYNDYLWCACLTLSFIALSANLLFAIKGLQS